MILVDNDSKVLSDGGMEFLVEKCNNFILDESPVIKKDYINFYFRQFLDLNEPLVHSIGMELESYIKDKFYTNLELKSIWINKIDVNSNKDDKFHTDISPCSLILYLNDDYSGGELEYINDTGSKSKIIPQKNLIITMSNRLQHRVLPISNGVRYSLVAFFGFIKKENKSII